MQIAAGREGCVQPARHLPLCVVAACNLRGTCVLHNFDVPPVSFQMHPRHTCGVTARGI